MHIKLIRVMTTPERKAGFLERQKSWNEVMALQPGFVDSLVASDTQSESEIVIITVWRDRESLERFMSGDHDAVQDSSGIGDFYDQLVISQLSVEESVNSSSAGHLLFAEGGAGVIRLSQAYRASAILRAAVTSGLFEKIGCEGASLPDLADQLLVPPSHLERLCRALTSLGLLWVDKQAIVRLTASARAHLLPVSPGYLGHLILHNTRPALWNRWAGLAAELQLPDLATGISDQELFMKAMGDVAGAGQTEELLRHIHLQGRQRMLDVGGALGAYSQAILRTYPKMCADVLDRPESLELAGPLDRQQSRLRFIAGDYRSALPAGPYDVVLLANILRGETRVNAEQLLARVYSVLEPGGLVLLYDLFPDTTAGHSGMLANLFGLHLPAASNPTTEQATAMLLAAGFVKVDRVTTDASLIANALLTACVPGT